MADLIVDTDILIDVGRGVREAVEYLDLAIRESDVAISSMSEMELLIGCRDKQEARKISRLLKRLRVTKISEPITDLAVRLVTR